MNKMKLHNTKKKKVAAFHYIIHTDIQTDYITITIYIIKY